MNFLKKNQLAIGGGIGLVLLIWVYFTYFASSSSAPLTSTDANGPLAGNLLVTLQSITSITLPEAIFKDPAFLSLNDFGVTLPPENVGRRNPFAPVGATGAPAAPAATSTLKLPPTR